MRAGPPKGDTQMCGLQPSTPQPLLWRGSWAPSEPSAVRAKRRKEQPSPANPSFLTSGLQDYCMDCCCFRSLFRECTVDVHRASSKPSHECNRGAERAGRAIQKTTKGPSPHQPIKSQGFLLYHLCKSRRCQGGAQEG